MGLAKGSIADTPKAKRREWIGLAVLTLPCLLYSMDLTVLHLAVPKLSADLKPSSAQLLWIIDVYGFFVAGSLLTMGTLGDRIGRRKLLLIGAVAFGLASLLAAFSNSAEQLIASRAVLGIAGATLAPSTLSLLRNMFLDEDQRTQAIAVIITAYSAGGVIGPLIGGVMLEFFWWGSVFLIAVPVMLLLLVVGPHLLSEYRDPNAGRPDLLSAGLAITAVLATIYGLKQTAQDGPTALSIAAVIAGLVLAVLFVRRQRQLADPLIDLSLFQHSGFSASVATYALTLMVMFGAFLFLPQYLQLVLGMSPLEAGLWTLPSMTGFIVGSMATPRIAARFGAAPTMAVGLLLAAVGFAIFTQIDTTTSILVVTLASVAFTLGTSPIFTLTNALILGSAPPERAGAASGISETAAEFGSALGIAVFGSIGIAIYRSAMAAGIPAGVPPAAADTARDTLGGAVEVAGTLPEQIGVSLVTLARNAFVDGMQVAAVISTVGAIALAIFVASVLRRVEATSSQAEAGATTIGADA
jgi:MFS transporter, DHA2 family, multidrug resistance protein